MWHIHGETGFYPTPKLPEAEHDPECNKPLPYSRIGQNYRGQRWVDIRTWAAARWRPEYKTD